MSYIPFRSTTEGRKRWQRYWQALGQKWRTEPEINKQRRRYLASLCDTSFNENQIFYPFQNVELSRGDVEWLLMKRIEKPNVQGV
ncbi:MAG: hypothetical protein ACJ788_01780 [Ktedonobacteraceae bacterium]